MKRRRLIDRMNVDALAPVLVNSGFRRDYVLEGTTKFGMLHSALGLVQTEPNACDVSSTRSKDRPS